MALTVRLGDRPVRDGDTVSVKDASSDLEVDWDADPNLLYEMYVMDAQTGKHIGHYVNIPGNRIDLADARVEYNIRPYLNSKQVKPISVVVNRQLHRYDPQSVSPNVGILIFTISPISEQQRKYCSCILKVAAKQPSQCVKERNWGKGCANPYAICGRLPHDTNECFLYLDYAQLEDDQLQALAYLQNMEVPKPYSRFDLIRRFEQKRDAKK